VLLPIVHSGGEAALLLTKRTDTVERHKGQISLPGGVIEPDESPQAAAVRETSEEIGVRTEDITILGSLTEEETVVSGFVLAPFVGSIPYPYPFRLSPGEVRAVLEVPIRVLLDPRNVRTETWDRGGDPRLIYFYSIGSDVVWGATARVITQFLQVVFDVSIPHSAGRG
jgi:8-oxo-dGTP pyrophosphatase MutT (NUDIX family)